MKFRFSNHAPFKFARGITAALLAVALIMASAATPASAAEETVTGLAFDYDASDYNSSTSSLESFIEDDTVHVSVLASISGSSAKKDVTAEAVWKSSNTAIVKADKGALTGVGKGTATVSAAYKGFTVSIKTTSDYVYDSVTMMQNNAAAPSSVEIEIGQALLFTLEGTKAGSAKDVTDDAVWTTSSPAVAAVENGEVSLLGTGTATITAKHKGKSDSIIVKVGSPYKSIKIDSGAESDSLLELELGNDDKPLSASVELKTGGLLDVSDKAEWKSANEKIAAVDKGIVKAVGAGKTSITVSHKGVSASIDIVVRTAYQSLKLSPEKEYHMLLQNAPLQISAAVLSNANVEASVTSLAEWTSSNVVVATVSEGKVTPKAVGTAKITAAYKGVTRSIDVTVYPSIGKLSVESATIDGFNGSSGELPKVTAETFDGAKLDVSKLVSWSSENEDVAIIQEGRWSAKKIGESILTATVQGLKAEVALTVRVKPLKLAADAKEISVILGKETALPSVTAINEDGTEEDVSDRVAWKASSDDIALKKDTMKGLEAAAVTLTASYLNKTATVRVKIEEEIVRLSVDPAAIELNPGKSKTVKVTGYYKSGKQVSIGSKMNWKVEDEKLASVNGASVKALAVGTTKLSGSYQGKTVTVAIIITPKLKSLALSDKSLKLSPGEEYTVTLKAVYATGSAEDATEAAVWTTSKASVATVKDGKITAVGKGSASIKATFSGKSVTIRVTVK